MIALLLSLSFHLFNELLYMVIVIGRISCRGLYCTGSGESLTEDILLLFNCCLMRIKLWVVNNVLCFIKNLSL